MTLTQFLTLSAEEKFAAFVAFVESKPKDEKYYFTDIFNCALAQFAKSFEDYTPEHDACADCWYVDVKINGKRKLLFALPEKYQNGFSAQNTFGELLAFLNFEKNR